MNTLTYEVECEELNLMFIIEVAYEIMGEEHPVNIGWFSGQIPQFRMLEAELKEVQLNGKAVVFQGSFWGKIIEALDPEREIYKLIGEDYTRNLNV